MLLCRVQNVYIYVYKPTRLRFFLKCYMVDMLIIIFSYFLNFHFVLEHNCLTVLC